MAGYAPPAAPLQAYLAQTLVLGGNPSTSVCDLLTTRSQPADLRYQP